VGQEILLAAAEQQIGAISVLAAHVGGFEREEAVRAGAGGLWMVGGCAAAAPCSLLTVA
jgi:hypothetical protein